MKKRLYHLSLLLTVSYVVQTITVEAQSKVELKNNIYTQQLESLVKNKQVKEAFAIIDNLEPITRQEHIELTQVPAPPFKEAIRAQRFKELLNAAGAENIWIDSIGNVLALRKGKKRRKDNCT